MAGGSGIARACGLETSVDLCPRRRPDQTSGSPALCQYSGPRL